MQRSILSLSSALLLAMLASAPERVQAATPAEEARSATDAIVGEWWTEKKDGRVKFFRAKNGTYQGILVWDASDKDGTKKDTKNPDPAMRNRPVVGIVLMWHLTFKDNEYEDSRVYDPDSGKTYKVEARVERDGRLKVHGYVGISVFGSSEHWTRV